MKMILPFIALTSAFLVSCGSTNQKAFPAQAPTGAETPLFNAINKARLAEGKKPLKSSAKLNALAASESARLAESGSRKPDIAALRSRSGYQRAAVLVGDLKDRGPQTGASYPDYWMKSKSGEEYLLGDWYRVGTGTAKSKDGELVSIVIFGNVGGVSLMNPM